VTKAGVSIRLRRRGKTSTARYSRRPTFAAAGRPYHAGDAQSPELAETASSPKKPESPPNMPNSKALASLRAAILEERMNPQDAQQVLDRYKG